MALIERAKDGRYLLDESVYNEYLRLKDEMLLKRQWVVQPGVANILFKDLLAHQRKLGWPIKDSVSFENLIDSLIDSYDKQRKMLETLRRYVDFESSDGYFEDMHPDAHRTLMMLTKEKQSNAGTQERDIHPDRSSSRAPNRQR